MKLQLKYGVVLLSISFMTSLMILGVGKCLVALIEATRLYFSLKAF